MDGLEDLERYLRSAEVVGVNTFPSRGHTRATG
jgi:hypothetical protein